MRALILTAGLGTRLRPLTSIRAKAAVPVNGEPMARRVITWLVREGVTDLVLNLHHRPATVTGVVGDGQDLGARVRYSWENPVLGSAGGPRRALPLLVDPQSGGGDTFLLVNGDTLTDLQLEDMLRAHAASGALVTMALVPNPRPDVYGGVLLDGARVAGFTKPGAVRESFHFIGVQVAERRAFEQLPDGVAAESVNRLYPDLMRERPGAVGGYVVEAPFSDVGTPADYLHASLELAAREGDRLVSSVGVAIHPSARVRRTAVWDHVSVGPDASLEECIVCDGVVIPPGARLRRCAVVPARGSAPAADERVEGDLLLRPF